MIDYNVLLAHEFQMPAVAAYDYMAMVLSNDQAKSHIARIWWNPMLMGSRLRTALTEEMDPFNAYEWHTS